MQAVRVFLAGAALAVPLVAATAGLLAVSVAERAGGTMFGARPPVNLAEAAGLARADLVVKYLRDGQDPRQVYPLHPDVVSSTILAATPLEAAVWSRRVQLIALLDREGAIGAGAERHALACLAADVGVDDIVAYLAPGGPPECVRGAAITAVGARTPREEER